MPFETILLDLGNVLMNFSHQRMCQQIAAVYQTTEDKVKTVLFENRIYQQFDRGDLSESEVHSLLNELFGRSCSREQLRQAVGDIFVPNEEMIGIVRQLSQTNLRLVLLSNTCPTHIDWIRANSDVLNSFDELVLSYEVHACKPEDAIFIAAIEAIHCDPQDCFYTDDIAEYVETARKHGFSAEVFENVSTYNRQLRDRNIDLNFLM